MITEQVANILETAQIPFEPLAHERTETALGEARVLGVTAATVAKTIVVATPTGHIRTVVPASERLDLHKVRSFLGLRKGDIRLLSEDELAHDYPEFELGAVPPFGGAHTDRVLVDCRLVDHEQIVLEAGTHDTSVRMATGRPRAPDRGAGRRHLPGGIGSSSPRAHSPAGLA